MAEVVSARLGSDLLERLDDVRGNASRGAWLAELVTRELTSAATRPAVAASAPGAAIGALAAGVHSPGVYCSTPQCWQTDTSKYGQRQLPLCPACAHAACGLEYRLPLRDLPPAWRGRKAEAVSQ